MFTRTLVRLGSWEPDLYIQDDRTVAEPSGPDYRYVDGESNAMLIYGTWDRPVCLNPLRGAAISSPCACEASMPSLA
jgi:hypothetical protein